MTTERTAWVVMGDGSLDHRHQGSLWKPGDSSVLWRRSGTQPGSVLQAV